MQLRPLKVYNYTTIQLYNYTTIQLYNFNLLLTRYNTSFKVNDPTMTIYIHNMSVSDNLTKKVVKCAGAGAGAG